VKLVKGLLIGVRNGKLSGQTSNIVLKNADENVRLDYILARLKKLEEGISQKLEVVKAINQ